MDILRVVLGNNEDGNVLDQLKLVVHVVGDGLELLDGTSDKKVALFGGGDLGLDLSGVGEGHVHGAAGLLLEGLGDLREGVGHAGTAINVELMAVELLLVLGEYRAGKTEAACANAQRSRGMQEGTTGKVGLLNHMEPLPRVALFRRRLPTLFQDYNALVKKSREKNYREP